LKIKKLIEDKSISVKIREMAAEINSYFKDSCFTLLSILNGSFIFTSDLARELSKYTLNFDIKFIRLKSYAGKKSTGKIDWIDFENNLKNKNILVVDDIFDSGLTLQELYGKLKKNGNNVKTAVLLIKETERSVNIEPDFYGFKIPDKFVVGYGLDYNEQYRGLPYIGYIPE